LIFVVATVVTISTVYWSEPCYNFIIGRNIKTPFVNLFAIVFGVSLQQLPRRNFARYVLMVFILYCLVLRGVYQGGIYNIIKTNQRKPELASIDKIMEKKYDFYMYDTLASRAKDYKFYEMRKVYPNEEIDVYRKKTLDPKFRGVVFSYLNLVLYLNEQNYKNYSYRICKESFLTNNFVFYFVKNHYLVAEVNDLLELMLMNGMIEHITKQYTSSTFYQAGKDNKQPNKLQLEHFIGAFRMLFMFSVISFAVFILEMTTKIKKLKKISDCLRNRMLK
jgi:hypothetical protein